MRLTAVILSVLFGGAPLTAGEIQPLAGLPVPGSQLLVPLAASEEGVKTDLTIRNARNVAQSVAITFMDADGYYGDFNSFRTVQIAPLATITYEDVVGDLLQTSTSGLILIAARMPGQIEPDPDARLTAAYRVYGKALGGEGTTSRSGIAVDLSSSEFARGTIGGLHHDASFETRYVVINLGLPRTFRITGRAPSAALPLFLHEITLRSAHRVELQLPVAWTNYGSLALTIEEVNPEGAAGSGYWTAYGSMSDRISGDGWLQMIVPE